MKVINWTRNGETGSKKVHDFAFESTLRNFRNAGYTIVEAPTETPAPIAPAAPVTEGTGRVGKGKHVHRIVEGHATCGTSFRRNRIAYTTVRITGEEITCGNCR